LKKLHEYLEAILAKAHLIELDWAKQFLFALFVLRQALSRSTWYYPYELVFGKNIKTPFELLYSGWREDLNENLDVFTYVDELCERLKLSFIE